MRKFYLVLAFVTAVLMASPASAGVVLSIGEGGKINLQDTATLGDTIYGSVWVVNNGDTAFSGDIILNSGVNTGTEPKPLAIVPVNGFQPNDSIQIPISFILNPPGFTAGANIVVVWPTGNSAMTGNIAMKWLWVRPLVGLEDLRSPAQGLQVFPNPCRDFFSLDFGQPGLSPELTGISVFDLTGKEVIRIISPAQGKPIYTAELAPGEYYIRVQFNDHTSSTRKIIKIH